MKFEKRFFYSVIPEWKDRYLNYSRLCSQIKLIKKAALNLAKAYANIKAITGSEVDMEIQIDTMASDKIFWKMLTEDLDKVEEFYKTQLQHFTEQFHILTLQAIRIGLIHSYEPFTRGLSTRLERELERLAIPGQIELSTQAQKELNLQPLANEGFLFRLDKSSRMDEVLGQIRTKKTSNALHQKDLNPHTSDDDDVMYDDDSTDEEMPVRLTPARGSLRKQYRDADSEGYDSGKSEAEPDAPGSRGQKRSRALSSIKLRALSRDDITGTEDQSMKMMQYGTPTKYGASDPIASPRGAQKGGVFPPPNDEHIINIDDSESFDDKPSLKRSRGGSSTPFSPTKGGNSRAQTPSTTSKRQHNIPRDSPSEPAPPAAPPTPHPMVAHHKIDVDKAKQQLRSALSEFYRGLILLQNFATLNVEATLKILKKHDKNIELGAREKFTQSNLQEYSFYRRRSLKVLMRETEHVFARCFTDGHRTDAMKVLRVPAEKKSVGVATFRFGLFLGISVALFILCMYLTTVIDTRLLDKMRPGLLVYRMLAVLVLMLWYWGIDMYVWTQYRVNYVFIFEFNPRQHVRYQHVFEAAATLTVIIVANLLLYMITSAQDGIFGYEITGFTWLENVPPLRIRPASPLRMFIVRC